MKPILTFFALLGWAVGYGQLYGAQWMLGPNTTRIDFRNDTIVNDSIQFWMNTFNTNAAICDSSGNLSFYTNGIYVANGVNGDSILNGNGLSPCGTTAQYGAQGLPFQQGAIFLPMPGNDRYVYLLHYAEDTVGNPNRLYYSVIDRNGNGGLGEIVQKNILYYGPSPFWAGGLTACKHGNGRDWWIVMHGRNDTQFFVFLLTPDGIADTIIQNIGAEYNTPYDNSYACFSPDGSKYACGAFEGLITIMDFDRCTGEFSNYVNINNIDGQTNSGEGPLAFSPNGRFLYAANRIDLTQFDLWNLNQDSVQVYKADSSDFAQIDFIALAINGKIYGSTWNGGFEFLHVVNYPDSLGASCDFVWGGQPTLSVNSVNLSNQPNYMLGALQNSACDTITSVSSVSPVSELHVQPNPANKFVYVEMGTPASGQSGRQGNYEFDLLNALGQLIATKQTRQVDIFDTEGLANGVYYIREKPTPNPDRYQGPEGDLNTVITRKLVVQH